MAPKNQPNKYQIAGTDDLNRGFNRQAEIRHENGQYHAMFRYEKFLLKVEPQETEYAALSRLISELQERGYTQLRSRLHFRGDHYLGNQEIWEEHPDAPKSSPFSQVGRRLRQIWNHVRKRLAFKNR